MSDAAVANLKSALLELADEVEDDIDRLEAIEAIERYCEIKEAIAKLTSGGVQSYSIGGYSFSKIDVSQLTRLADRYRARIDNLLLRDSAACFARDAWDY